MPEVGSTVCSHRRFACLLLLLLLPSCTIWSNGSDKALQWHVPLPTDAAATILSAAVTKQLRADPIAMAGGAPASPDDRHGYAVAWTGNGHGDWLPRASHRLVLRAGRTQATVQAIALTDTPLVGFRALTREEVRLRIERRERGCCISLHAPAYEGEQLAPLIERTLFLACSVDGSGPGLAEPNLAAWRLSRLLAAAANTADAGRRDELLRRAALQPSAPSWLFQQLAEVAASNGQFAEAARYVNRGMLAEPDAFARARLAQLAHGFALRTIEPPDLRARAMHLLGSGDLENAEKLLHSARRSDSRPDVDYRLLGELHRKRGDKMAAMAAELLAREYAADKAAATQNAGIALDRTLSERLRQLATQRSIRATPASGVARPASPPR